MDETQLDDIVNFKQLTEDIATAGQPTETQLAAVARAGYAVVINLALTDQLYSLADERATVASLGMVYHPIPVIWEHPTLQNLHEFFHVMDRHAHDRCFVHCALNMRVATFTALYGMRRWGWSEERARAEIRDIWELNATWDAFFLRAVTGRLGNPDTPVD